MTTRRIDAAAPWLAALLLPLLLAAAGCPAAAAADVAGSARSAPAADAPAPISPARARATFILHCAGCHQIDGAGHPRFGVPSMRGALGGFLATPAGRAFLVQVPGARNASISDAELAALTNWELATFSPQTLPADFIPYTTDEVRTERARPPGDVAAARAAIVADHARRNAGPQP